MDGEVEYEFEGNAECDMCGALVGLMDPEPIPPPHENCGCNCVPRCNNSYTFGGSSSRYGTGGNCFTFNATVVVICWDRSTIEYEVPIDFGCNTGADYDGSWEAMVWDQLADEAQAMEAGCPDCTAPNVS